MEDTTESARLGARIRSIRIKRKMSVTELGRRVGVSKSLISQIERGVANPSISVLRSIASALDVPVFTLMAEDVPGDALVRRDKRQRLHVPGSNVVRELLVPDLHRRMILLCATFLPGDVSAAGPASHNGEECVVVLKGQIDVEVNGQGVTLNVGDSLYFDSKLPHSFHNRSDEPAEILVAISSSFHESG